MSKNDNNYNLFNNNTINTFQMINKQNQDIVLQSKYRINLNTFSYIKFLRKKQLKTYLKSNIKINLSLIKFIHTIVLQFNFSFETFALSLYIYYEKVFSKISYSANHLLYASISLLIAAKALQNTPTTPKISYFKVFACSYINMKQYAKIERQILQLLQYKIHYITFVDYINYYLSKGVIFQAEISRFNNTSEEIQNKLYKKVQQFILNGDFLKYQQEKLAAYILYTTRQYFNLLDVWNKFIQDYSGISIQQIKLIINDFNRINLIVQKQNVSATKLKEILSSQKKSRNNDKIFTIQKIKQINLSSENIGLKKNKHLNMSSSDQLSKFINEKIR